MLRRTDDDRTTHTDRRPAGARRRLRRLERPGGRLAARVPLVLHGRPVPLHERLCAPTCRSSPTRPTPTAASARPTCGPPTGSPPRPPTRGAGQTVALVDAYDDPTIESDLNTYRAYYGIPPCTTANGCFRKVNQDGEQGNYPLANPDWDPEIALDTEMVSAICPKCHILLVEANSADESIVTSNPVQHSDLGAAVDTAVNLGATEVSNSYGSAGPEPDDTFFDHYYDHPGVAITASAGDSDYGTIWPAASPYVTAVGGTELVADPTTARGLSESVWGSAYPGVLPNEAQGTGSGCSLFEPKPAWQHDAGCSGRTVADVSAVADNVAIYDSSLEIGGWGVVAGTSIASPIIASVYALAGNAKSVVYGSYPYSHTKGLFDVTDGLELHAEPGVRLPVHRPARATTARPATARRTASPASKASSSTRRPRAPCGRGPWSLWTTLAAVDTKDAERAYPETLDETHRGWLHSKPFRNDPAETSRLLVDAALIILVLDLRDGVSLCELGCGTGWLSRFAARQGVRAVGYDISPGMVEIAREEAAREGVDVRYEVADMETLEPDEQFDTCLLYDALHHSTRPDLVLATARKTLRPGGRLLLHEPNWMHRFAGRAASQEHGVTEAGYSARRLKQLDARGRVHGRAPPPPDRRALFIRTRRSTSRATSAGRSSRARWARSGPRSGCWRTPRERASSPAAPASSARTSSTRCSRAATTSPSSTTSPPASARTCAPRPTLAERDIREDLGDVFDDARPEVVLPPRRAGGRARLGRRPRVRRAGERGRHGARARGRAPARRRTSSSARPAARSTASHREPATEESARQPLSPYGTSKLAAEEYLRTYNRLYESGHVALRYGNVYGPRQDPHGEAGVVAIFFNRLKAGEAPRIFGDGQQTRDYVFVGDVVDATLAGAGVRGGVFNVGTGRETSVVELFDACRAVAGVDARAGLRARAARRAAAQRPGHRPRDRRARLAAAALARRGPRRDLELARRLGHAPAARREPARVRHEHARRVVRVDPRDRAGALVRPGAADDEAVVDGERHIHLGAVALRQRDARDVVRGHAGEVAAADRGDPRRVAEEARRRHAAGAARMAVGEQDGAEPALPGLREVEARLVPAAPVGRDEPRLGERRQRLLQRLRHRVAGPLQADQRERVGAAVGRGAGVDGSAETGKEHDHGNEETRAHKAQSKYVLLKEV